MNLLITNPTSSAIDFMVLLRKEALFVNKGITGSFVTNEALNRVSCFLEVRTPPKSTSNIDKNESNKFTLEGTFAVAVNGIIEPYYIEAANLISFFEENQNFKVTLNVDIDKLYSFENLDEDNTKVIRLYRLTDASKISNVTPIDTSAGSFNPCDSRGGSFEIFLNKKLPEWNLDKEVAHAGVVSFDFDESKGPMTIINPETKEEVVANNFEELVTILKSFGYEVTEVDVLQGGV